VSIPGVIQGILEPAGTPLKFSIKRRHRDEAEITPELETSMLHRVPSGD